MSIPVEFAELADELARDMVARILESSTIEEVKELIEEMETDPLRSPEVAKLLSGELRRPMAGYRAYTVGPDGYFTGYQSLICGTDSEAIEKAKRLLHGQDVELWSGAHFVIRLNQKPL
jgi:hypothetical protein